MVGGRPTRRRSTVSMAEPASDSSDDPLSTRIITKTMGTKRKTEPDIDDAPLGSTSEEGLSSSDSSLSDVDPAFEQSFTMSDTNSAKGETSADDTAGGLQKRWKPNPITKTPLHKEAAGSKPRPRQGRRIRPPSIRPYGLSDTKPSPPEYFSSSNSPWDPSPNRKIRTYAGRTEFRNIHSAAPTPKKEPQKKGMQFKFPPEEPESRLNSSQATSSSTPKIEFKYPTGLPDTFSASSMPTSSSRGNEATMFDATVLGSDDSGSSLSDIPPSVSDDLKYELHQSDLCPICSVKLEDSILDEYGPIEKLGLRQQSQLCRVHRQRTAEKQWVQRGYPTINWKTLHSRIDRYLTDLELILTLKKPSFYRNELENSATNTSRKVSTFRATFQDEGLDRISSGYYGARGAKTMMDAIISKFAPMIRELAPSDSLMQAIGVSGYVQAVLAPELTVLLVMEDMKVDRKTARKIMEESMEIGDLLNEPLDDVVKVTQERRNSSVAED
ncbi:hypothetical protein FQN57_005901 [Myotisia sp. PD_48]|nr:hypothetical protein FQN57_005901 [Myotisia sp. PD_48]